MANPTTNYGFVLPTSSDLVTDLPADFDVALQGVDTRLKALNPETTLGDLAYGSATANTKTRLAIGTTGQVLTVSGGVPTWGTPNPGDITGVTPGVGISGGGTSGDVTVTNSMATAITTNGDLIYGTGSGTFTRRGIGSTGQVLSVSGGVPTWATPSAGSWTLAASAALSGASVTVSSLSGKQYYIYLEGWSSNSAASVCLRFNGDTGANYRRGDSSSAEDRIFMNGQNDQNAGATLSNGAFVNMADTAMSRKPVQNVNGLLSANGSTGGWYVSTSAITSVTMFPNNGSWDAGTYYIWSFA